ncbi:MAG: hypothetical protein WA913_00255 [Pricia sp.]
MAKSLTRKLLWTGILLFLVGCSTSIDKEDLKNLNGYWEIEQVEFPGGGAKEYRVNTTVDYIQFDDMKGYRKKMQPRFDGTYRTSDDAEAFEILEKDGSFIIHYKTELSEWSEELVGLDTNTFSVVNEDGKRYDYKRFEAISVGKE